DGIRDDLVTGVQTCALPIFLTVEALDLQIREDINALFSLLPRDFCLAESRVEAFDNCGVPLRCTSYFLLSHFRFRRQARESVYRSEERRVGKGSRLWCCWEP